MKERFSLKLLKRKFRKQRSSKDISNLGLKRWKLLRNVFHAVSVLRNSEIETEEELDSIILQLKDFPIRDPVCKAGSLSEQSSEEHLFLCAERGNSQDLEDLQLLVCKEKTCPAVLLDKRNREGLNPLYVAARNGNTEVVKLLLELGADHTVKCKGESLLEVAVRWKHEGVVRVLLRYPWDRKTVKSAMKSSVLGSLKNLLGKVYRKKHRKSCCL